MSSIGLCDADITTPHSAPYFLVKYATPGVGITPTVITSQPTDINPAINAASSISPDCLVSLPTTTFTLYSLLARTYPPALPNLYAKSQVSSLLATPLTPSVPKYFLIKSLLPKMKTLIIIISVKSQKLSYNFLTFIYI